jgi:hypothetical protein
MRASFCPFDVLRTVFARTLLHLSFLN